MAQKVAPEGTQIRMANGEMRVKRGGAWVPVDAVNPNAPGSGYFSGTASAPKLPESDRKVLATTRQSAVEAGSMAQDAERFRLLNEDVDTGGIDDWGAFGTVTSMFDSKKQQMNAIAKRLVPQQRVPGSGPFTDADAALEAQAGLSIEKQRPTNSAIAGAMKAGAKRREDYAAFMEYWARRNGSLLGASEAWSDYANANQLFAKGKEGIVVNRTTPWRDWFGVGQVGGARPVAPGAGATRPAAPRAPAPRPTGKPIDALMRGAKVVANGGRPMSPQEASKLPPGARFVGMDGIERTVK